MTDQALEELSNRQDQHLCRPNRLTGVRIRADGNQKQRVDLCQASACNHQCLDELAAMLTRLTLGDVRRDRDCSATQLISKRVAFLSEEDAAQLA